MDVIVFSTDGAVVYRQSGEHSFVAGMGGVTSVTKINMAAPKTHCSPFVTNICGAFRCPFYRQGREGILFNNPGFGGHQVMHHIDGLLQVKY